MLLDRDAEYLADKKKELIDRCKTCKGSDLQCACYRNYLLEVAKVKAAIPLKYRHFQFEDIDSPESQGTVKKVESYTKKLARHKKSGKGLYLWGNSGNAKTTLSCITLTHALKEGHSAYFTDLPKCMELITEGWKNDSVKANFVEQILKTDFLVIDDVGREYRSRTGFTETHFDLIFRERANNLLPTILTSNLSPNDIGSDYGKRLLSIFYEHLIPVEFAASDYRKKVLSRGKEKNKPKNIKEKSSKEKSSKEKSSKEKSSQTA